MRSHLRCPSCGCRRKPSHEKHKVGIPHGCLEKDVAARLVEKHKHLEPRKPGV